MANIRKADPYATQVPSLRDEMNRLFDNFFTAPGLGTLTERHWPATWYPALDVSESDGAFLISAELPGLKPEEVDINLTGNLLTLKGEKKEEKDEKTKNWHRVERSYGAFVRSIQLPDTIDPERAKASYDHGVLRIEIAKKEASRPRSIKVDVK
jgi:HSP20 family protein